MLVINGVHLRVLNAAGHCNCLSENRLKFMFFVIMEPKCKILITRPKRRTHFEPAPCDVY